MIGYLQAHDAVAARLSAEALAHSERVAEEAARIAGFYGMDPELARIAGVLHDWSREDDAETLVRCALESGIPVTEVECEVPYLLHGPVGAAEIARELPGVPEAVVRAVARHTCGDDHFDSLGMVLYIADSAEPERRHPAAADLRELAGAIPLEDLFSRAYAASVEHLVKLRLRIHPSTVATWNRYVAGVR